jgi:WhiB family redox-sensing transcriptional regulator
MWQDPDVVACKPDQMNLFFSELKSKVAKAKAICDSCPVKQKCLEFALSNDEEFGVFGGTTPQERKNLVSH